MILAPVTVTLIGLFEPCYGSVSVVITLSAGYLPDYLIVVERMLAGRTLAYAVLPSCGLVQRCDWNLIDSFGIQHLLPSYLFIDPSIDIAITGWWRYLFQQADSSHIGGLTGRLSRTYLVQPRLRTAGVVVAGLVTADYSIVTLRAGDWTVTLRSRCAPRLLTYCVGVGLRFTSRLDLRFILIWTGYRPVTRC